MPRAIFHRFPSEDPLRIVTGLVVFVLLGACSETPDLPAGPHELEILRRHSTFRQRPGTRVDVSQAPPSRVEQLAMSRNVGNIKVIVGDSTNVSSVLMGGGTGYGLRQDEGRQDIARITRQVIEEQGDIFDFIVVFPAFDDVLNPGFAYFNTIRNTDQGIGLEMLDLSTTFGSQGRLQGFLNMNSPAAYRGLDGLPISDPSSSIFGIMGQEMTHRWLAFARVKKDGFNDGQTSTVLMGRDQAHWSALMHTGPVHAADGMFVSVQDGVAWRDNGNGTFTVEEVFSNAAFSISPRARFSTLDLYLMGLLPPEEVDPFYVILGARMGTTTVPPSARLEPGITVSGQRLDLSVDNVIAAMGERVPSHLTAQRDFNMAVVVLTRPGQGVDEVMPLIEEVDAFRRTWEQRFSTWTGGRASLCSSLLGNCTMAHVNLGDVELVEDVDDGVLTPGEDLTIFATIENNGDVPSQSVEVLLDASAPSSVVGSPAHVGVVQPGARARVTLRVRPLESHPCNAPITLRVRAQEGGNITDSVELSRIVGLRVVHAWRMEEQGAFTVNPLRSDTAVHGRWARGRGQRTDLRAQGRGGVIAQPGEDSDDEGTLAWLTDPGDDGLLATDVNATDVDEGVTTLGAPDIALAGLVDPVLSFKTWHTALVVDAMNGRVDEAAGDDLVTTISVDDALPIEVDRDGTNTFGWRQKGVRVRDVLGGSLSGSVLHVRFSVGDEGDEQNLVEAGIDDIVLQDVLPQCAPPAVSVSSSMAGTGVSSAVSGGQASSSVDSGVGGGGDVLQGPCACDSVEVGVPVPLGAVLVLVWRLRPRARKDLHVR